MRTATRQECRALVVLAHDIMWFLLSLFKMYLFLISSEVRLYIFKESSSLVDYLPGGKIASHSSLRLSGSLQKISPRRLSNSKKEWNHIFFCWNLTESHRIADAYNAPTTTQPGQPPASSDRPCMATRICPSRKC